MTSELDQDRERFLFKKIRNKLTPVEFQVTFFTIQRGSNLPLTFRFCPQKTFRQ